MQVSNNQFSNVLHNENSYVWEYQGQDGLSSHLITEILDIYVL